VVERGTSDTTGSPSKTNPHPGGMPALISATARKAVRSYIAHQEEHHRVKSFREELVEMLDKAGIEYDPKYLD
jgi:hypothetical protein